MEGPGCLNISLLRRRVAHSAILSGILVLQMRALKRWDFAQIGTMWRGGWCRGKFRALERQPERDDVGGAGAGSAVEQSRKEVRQLGFKMNKGETV